MPSFLNPLETIVGGIVGSVKILGSRIEIPNCKKCGEGLRSNGISTILLYGMGEEVKMHCRVCDKYYSVKLKEESK